MNHRGRAGLENELVQADRRGQAAAHGPERARTRPAHAFQQAAATDVLAQLQVQVEQQ